MSQDLQQLTPEEADLVSAMLIADAPLADVARHCDIPLIDAIHILSRPHVAAYLEAARSAARTRFQARAADLAPAALTTLHDIAESRDLPEQPEPNDWDAEPTTNRDRLAWQIERRRAATTIIRAAQPRRPRPPDRDPDRTPPRHNLRGSLDPAPRQPALGANDITSEESTDTPTTHHTEPPSAERANHQPPPVSPEPSGLIVRSRVWSEATRPIHDRNKDRTPPGCSNRSPHHSAPPRHHTHEPITFIASQSHIHHLPNTPPDHPHLPCPPRRPDPPFTDHGSRSAAPSRHPRLPSRAPPGAPAPEADLPVALQAADAHRRAPRRTTRRSSRSA